MIGICPRQSRSRAASPKTFGIDLAADRPFAARGKPTIEDVRAAHPADLRAGGFDHLVVFGGRLDHRSVARAVTAARVLLFDSAGFRRVPLDHCRLRGEARGDRRRLHVLDRRGIIRLELRETADARDAENDGGDGGVADLEAWDRDDAPVARLSPAALRRGELDHLCGFWSADRVRQLLGMSPTRIGTVRPFQELIRRDGGEVDLTSNRVLARPRARGERAVGHDLSSHIFRLRLALRMTSPVSPIVRRHSSTAPTEEAA